MKCKYEKCPKKDNEIENDFLLDNTGEDGIECYCSVACYFAFMKQLHIDVWGYSEGLEKDYFPKSYLEHFKEEKKENEVKSNERNF